MNQTESLQRQAFLWKLIDQLRTKGSWCGETHVQKTAFLVEQLAGQSLDAGFILYKHGPYSFQLSDELGAMQALGFIQVEVPNPKYGPRLQAGTAGSLLVEQFGTIANRSASAIEFVVSKLAGCGVVSLEKLSTALYFTVQEKTGAPEHRAQKIHSAKPHVSEEQALQAVAEVDRILAEWEAVHQNPVGL